MGPIAEYTIKKYVKRPERILVDELTRGNIGLLNEELAAAFIPMAYKFFEAAKEGEYEHNLRVLAELLKNELASDTPDVSAFTRMARRFEALTLTELKVIALINTSIRTLTMASTEGPGQCLRPYISAHSLSVDPNNKEEFDLFMLQEVLSDLAGRGLLVADGAARLGKQEEYYYTSSSFQSLIDKAKSSIARCDAPYTDAPS